MVVIASFVCGAFGSIDELSAKQEEAHSSHYSIYSVSSTVALSWWVSCLIWVIERAIWVNLPNRSFTRAGLRMLNLNRVADHLSIVLTTMNLFNL